VSTESSQGLEELELRRLGADDRYAFDCFNEDLVWILDKLVHRSGGIGGIISGHILEESRSILLAASSEKVLDAALIVELVKCAGAAPRAPGVGHDQPTITHRLLNHARLGGATGRYRLQHLPFSPAEGVKVVATVVKESRLGFNFIEEATARRLYPVLSRYVRLWWVHRRERRRAMTLSAVLDGSDLAVALLNRNAELLLASTRARLLLETRNGLMQDGRSLTSTSGGDRQSLKHAIQAALEVNQGSSVLRDVLRTAQVLQLQRRPGRRALIVTTAPVRTPAVADDDPAVIVYALDPDQEIQQLLTPVCMIYKLTPTEARLAGYLVNGHRVSEAAAHMCIGLQTARAYLKQVFNKTQTHRQADLVRVMLVSAIRTTVF